MPEQAPLPPTYWPLAELAAAYARRELSPVEVAQEAIARAQASNPALNAFLLVLERTAGMQALEAERAFRDGAALPLSGIPISIKDTFDVAGELATRGSLVYRQRVAERDSGCVRRLRAAGAVFIGKTNTAEFGQSATTENRLGDAARNPWDVTRTPGGSSGGAAASVAAGIVNLALGADGGGSIRIPAAFTGLAGFKPTLGLCRDEGGFRAMTDFVCPGPLAWRIEDARAMLGVLADAPFARGRVAPLRVAWCARPENRPVEPLVEVAAREAVQRIASLGHAVDEVDLDLAGWEEAFGPLVLEDERRERGHLLAQCPDQLTEYELKTLQAAAALDSDTVSRARNRLHAYRARVESLLDTWDLIVTPSTSVPAFPIDQRPRLIDGRNVDWLWGAFPFTAAFNVAGTPGVSLPCGYADGLPVGIQVVARRNRDGLLLDFAESLEEALGFDAASMKRRWAAVSPALSPAKAPA